MKKKDPKIESFFEHFKATRLPESVRGRVWEELSSHADFHGESEGVRVGDASRLNVQAQSYSVLSRFNFRFSTMKATLLIALVLAGGGTSLAAENAVPGDALYPVKVHFNEGVKSAFAIGADSEARLQAKLLEERLAEAEALAAEGRLEGETAADVRAGINTQLARTLAVNTDASTEVRVSVESTLNSALNAFQARLLAMDETQNSRVAADIAADVTAQTSLLAREESSADAAVSTMLAADIDPATIIANAEERLTGLRTTIESATELAAEIRADFAARLDVAAEHLAEARTSLAAEAEVEAQESVDAAAEILGEIEAELSTLGRIIIDGMTGSIIDIEVGGEGSEIINGEGSVDVEIDNDASLEGDMIDGGAGVDGSASGEAIISF